MEKKKVTIVNKQGIEMIVPEKLANAIGGVKPKILKKPPELDPLTIEQIIEKEEPKAEVQAEPMPEKVEPVMVEPEIDPLSEPVKPKRKPVKRKRK